MLIPAILDDCNGRPTHQKIISNKKNTLIIAARPSSNTRLTAIWSQLECFTASVDRIVLAVPDKEWSHKIMMNFTKIVESNLPSMLYKKISVRYYKNNRYDSGLWCDSLQEEQAQGVATKVASTVCSVLQSNNTIAIDIPDDDNSNYLLINDSLMAIRQYNGFFNALNMENDVSFVSLNYWLEPYWLESAARAFSLQLRGYEFIVTKSANILAKQLGRNVLP